MTRAEYDPERHKHESTCKICLCEYEPHDEITQLKCDERHYFHADCIARWV